MSNQSSSTDIMRVLDLAATLVALSASATLSTAASCSFEREFDGWSRVWTLKADGIDSIPNRCDAITDNLKRFAACTGFTDKDCNREDTDGKLVLKFRTVGACDTGMVHSAWFEATNNDFGPIKCSD